MDKPFQSGVVKTDVPAQRTPGHNLRTLPAGKREGRPAGRSGEDVRTIPNGGGEATENQLKYQQKPKNPYKQL
jgi:hypothetical protein